ncbi:MAG: glycosyl hydrolase, partial [Lachnospiraceae bacterium]|nr:glycosyl hydrolase [Lachnospiraceae bacterium]
GYELHYSLDFKKGYNTKRIASPKQAYATINKLTRKKKYSFRVRSYKKVKNITYYSAWSAVKSKKLN